MLAKTSKGFILTKTSNIGHPISSYNKSLNTFSIIHAIFAQISSIGAACRKKFKTVNEIIKNSFHEHLKNTPMGISSQNTLLTNFVVRSTDSHKQLTDRLG
jgi:hypothetical protein